jgi:hypothetical protein
MGRSLANGSIAVAQTTAGRFHKHTSIDRMGTAMKRRDVRYQTKLLWSQTRGNHRPCESVLTSSDRFGRGYRSEGSAVYPPSRARYKLGDEFQSRGGMRLESPVPAKERTSAVPTEAAERQPRQLNTFYYQTGLQTHPAMPTESFERNEVNSPTRATTATPSTPEMANHDNTRLHKRCRPRC